ncbi:class I SAM-dependent RNA methyltransferase [Bdellovibrio reynosensis]|uniref:Class I SAM-dependent RNA methyltransferase n=1 Tax=Bdellovibrio reynosensis TaxID=2835041 RepID=A0ABY4C7N9_9BACT|nr:class I SAM-dependent RNA methyltransferase [Bdellovibrio reynosensis]UOF00479.1 class I SAM-dependent RNA methyltransferase [Bdellovibrio reynosensis]
MLSRGSQINVTIEKMAIGGAGIARHEGMVLFIPLAAPADELTVEITLKKKNFAEAKIVKILKPGPSRRTPPCPVALVCGGCNWQQITEEEQRSQKQQLVLETIQKFNRGVEFEYLPIKASPRSLRYRNRIQPKFKNGNFGFFARNSHAIVDIKDCPITEEDLTAKFPEVRAFAEQKRSQDLLKLEMYIAEEGDIRYGLITDDDDGVGFSQVNRFQNEDLVATALEWAGDYSYKNVFDLYAGSGNFTFPLAAKYSIATIHGVELNPKLVERAKSRIGNKPIKYFLSDVENYMKKAVIGREDLVVLDPPRAGASEEIMKKLAQTPPRKIIYISCHPVSLARDLNWLFAWAQKLGKSFKLSRVQTFEMFPQTDHVETIAELVVDS